MDPRNSERTPGWTRACSARTELYPIPELLLEATASDLSAAGLSADKRQPAGEGEAGAHRAPEWHRVRHWPAKDWPAHREARGELALKASPDARRALGAECTVQHGVLTLSVAKRNGESSTVVAEVPVKDLAVGLQRAQTSMITLATLYEGKVYDEIYCFAGNQSERNQWIAAFRSMGVPIFNVSPGEC
jgi:hypothetical protein